MKQVEQNPYLGVTISNDLKWETHIVNITKKANSSLAFLGRNLRRCPVPCRKAAYLSLVRSKLEYGSVVWDPYLKKDINRLEQTQRQAARFISGDYKSREQGCVTNMLENLELLSLQERRQQARLMFLFNVAGGMVSAMSPGDFLTPRRKSRRIHAKKFTDYISSNPVQTQAIENSRCFNLLKANTEQYKNSFFGRSIIEWNNLSDPAVHAETVEAFRASLPRWT